MKRALLLFTALASLTLSSASLHAALSYWDANGTDPGAGVTPTGTWDPADPGPYFWSPDSAGASLTNAWTDGDTAVFSAGTDAIDAFTVTINGAPQAGGIIFEEGEATLSGGTITMTNAFEFPILCATNGIINSALADTSATCGFTKTGPGTLSLGGSSSNGGTNIVAEGFVACTVGGTSTPLGASGTTAPTVVSSGATLQIATAANFAETAIVNGSGVTNGGALRFTSGTLNWSSFIALDSDAKVTMEAGGTVTVTGGSAAIITNGSVNCNLTIGGNGGTIRLNGTYLNRSLNIGYGLLIKEGSSTLRFENPSRLGFPITWRGGNLFMRVNGIGSGDAGFSGYGTINVEAGANQFQMGTGGPSVAFANPLVLGVGAKPTFNTASTFTWTQNAAVSGPGGIGKTGQGTLTMNGAKTYTGDTTISAGTMSLSASGSIANSASIDVVSLATFDVSLVTGGFVLQSGQTLMGNGTVIGNVTANGALAPGESIGMLTFNNDLTIAGNLVLEVDTPLGFPPNDSFTVTGLLTNAGVGAVMVKTNGTPLAVNDTFAIFNQPLLNGQAMTVFGGGVVWTNELANSPYGQIKVVSLTPVAPPNPKVTAIGLNSVTLSATGGGAYQGYGVLASTNVAAPMSSWTLIGGATANGSGVISFTDTQALQQTKYTTGSSSKFRCHL